jgi:hypothetical protein
MSLLVNICNTINKKYLSEGDVVLKPVVKDPRIFTMLRIKDDTVINLGFYHVCNPRLLVTALSCSALKNRASLNDMLNLYVAKVLNETDYKQRSQLYCGNCMLSIPRDVASKLAIISESAKLKLR